MFSYRIEKADKFPQITESMKMKRSRWLGSYIEFSARQYFAAIRKSL